MKTNFAGHSDRDSENTAPMVRVNVRIPGPLYSRFMVEAENRAEDLSAPLRRALSAYFTKDSSEARLEAIERKLDSILRGAQVAQVLARLDEIQAGQEGAIAGKLDDLKAYVDAVARGSLDMEKTVIESLGKVVARLDTIAGLYSHMAKVFNAQFAKK